MQFPPVTVYRTASALIAQRGEDFFQLAESNLNVLFEHEEPEKWVMEQLVGADPILAPERFAAPIASQEVWAAGVTYLRSREARKDESKDSGGGSFYDRVYDAVRPEIFF